MHIDTDCYIWGDKHDPIGRVFLLTTGKLLVLSSDGIQILDYQKGDLSKEDLLDIAERGTEFYIGKYRSRTWQWSHPITREEFKTLTIKEHYGKIK